MVLMPEEGGEGSADEVEVVVLPLKAEHARPSPLASRGLRRPVLFGLIAACALAVAFVFVALLNWLAPGSSFTHLATAVFACAVGLLLLALPLATVASLPVIWFLFGRRGRSASGFDLTRSVLTVTAGVVTFAVAQYLILQLRSSMGARLPVSTGFLLTSDALAGLLAGWLTFRFSPTAPYRHAIGVGLVLALCVLLLVLKARSPWLPLASATFRLPVLLLGAWIGVRREPAAGTNR